MSVRRAGRLRLILTLACGIAMFVALAAPLPGEMRGCGGDTSGKVNVTDYCRDKCDIEAQKLRQCELLEDTDEAENENYTGCIESRQCAFPTLCQDVPNSHISNEEADQCFGAIEDLACGEVTLSEYGLIRYATTPPACKAEEICDPL